MLSNTLGQKRSLIVKNTGFDSLAVFWIIFVICQDKSHLWTNLFNDSALIFLIWKMGQWLSVPHKAVLEIRYRPEEGFVWPIVGL